MALIGVVVSRLALLAWQRRHETRKEALVAGLLDAAERPAVGRVRVNAELRVAAESESDAEHRETEEVGDTGDAADAGEPRRHVLRRL